MREPSPPLALAKLVLFINKLTTLFVNLLIYNDFNSQLQRAESKKDMKSLFNFSSKNIYAAFQTKFKEALHIIKCSCPVTFSTEIL